MKGLWVAAALAPLTFAASSALGQTCASGTCTFTGATTTPVATATVNSGAAGNITVSGSIIPANPTTATTQAAVTINSNNTVTNTGTIGYSAVTSTTTPVATQLTGVQVQGGMTGEVSNSGTIEITETTTGDTTNQGLTTGPFANGANRYGIYISGAGTTFTGVPDANNTLTGGSTGLGVNTAIYENGAISVTGNNSAGIYATANIAGDIVVTSAGSISVLGGNSAADDAAGLGKEVSYGILTTGTVGNVYIAGAISATGQNATAVALNGGSTGAITIDSSVTATGYRSTTNPGLTIEPSLLADQLLQGGPALYVGGNVSGGLTVREAENATTTPAVSADAGGTLLSYGSAPALLIGGAAPLTIGRTGGSGTPSIEIGGVVEGLGVYSNVSTTAVQIGGSNNLPVTVGGTDISGTGGVASGSAFGAVTLTGGIDVTGTVDALSLAPTQTATSTPTVTATGLLIGSGASVPSLTISPSLRVGSNVTGVLEASLETGPASGSLAGGAGTAIALQVAPGGSLGSITNNGIISATIEPILVLQQVGSSSVEVYAGGTTGTPIAIQDSDKSGNPITVTNTYSIVAAYINAPTAQVNPSGINARGIAMDFSGTTGAVNVTQNAYTGALPTGVTSVTPTITGEFHFGSGANTLTVNAGTVTGNLFYADNTGNALTINGASTVTGAIAETTGGQLAVEVNSGSLVMTAPTSNTAAIPGAITPIGTTTAPIKLSSLSVGSTGSITFAITPSNTNANATQFNVLGSTTLSAGAKINVDLTSALTTTNSPSFTLIQNTNGGAFTNGGTTTTLLGAVPFLYNASLTAGTTNTGYAVNLNLTEKTAADLTGFSAAEKSEFGSFLNVINSSSTATNYPTLVADLLSKTNQTSFRHAFDQFLPDYAGGPFNALELGQEAIYRAQSDVPLKMESDTSRSWVQEIGYGVNRDNTDAAGYTGGGFGVAGGMEAIRGDSAVGMTAAFLTASIKDAAQSDDGHLGASVLEGGVYARASGTGLNFDASLNVGWAWFNSERLFLDQSAPDTTTGSVTSLANVAQANWNGAIAAAHIGVKAPINLGRFYMRPEVSVDYFALYETGYQEHGGGTAFDLKVSPRTSQEALAQADLVLGMTFGDVIRWRPEVTVGYRDVIEGGPGSTKAAFSGQSAFTLSPNFNDKGGLLARLGVRAGGQFADFSADAGGEFGSGSQTYDARALARFLF